jgi:hypothetical protein
MDLPTLFGIACCLTVLLARGMSRMLLALILCETWAISNLGWQWNMLNIYPVIDLAIACISFVMWFETRSKWLGVFVALAASQLALHAIYDIEGAAFQLTYLFLLNVTFALELLVISWKGLANVRAAWVRCIRSFLSFRLKLSAAKAMTGV